MKKLYFAALAAFLIGATSAVADMFDRSYELSTSGTGAASRVYVLRGELKAVAIERTGSTAILGGTNMTVTVTSPFGTHFSYAWDGNTDTLKHPLAVADKVSDGSSTSSVYTPTPLSGAITVAVAPPSGVAVTNDFKVTIIYDR